MTSATRDRTAHTQLGRFVAGAVVVGSIAGAVALSGGSGDAGQRGDRLALPHWNDPHVVKGARGGTFGDARVVKGARGGPFNDPVVRKGAHGAR